MKQPHFFKVDIYLQIQLYHQRIRAQCCPWPLWPPTILGTLALIQSQLFSVPANNYRLRILSLSINDLLSSVSNSSSSSILSSDLSKSTRLLLGLEGCSCAADRVAPIFCEYSGTIFTAERVLIFGLLIIWQLSCLRVPQLDVIILLDKTSSYSKCDWLPRMGFFCLWELRTSCKDFFSEELIFLVRSSKYKQNPVKEFP